MQKRDDDDGSSDAVEGAPLWEVREGKSQRKHSKMAWCGGGGIGGPEGDAGGRKSGMTGLSNEQNPIVFRLPYQS